MLVVAPAARRDRSLLAAARLASSLQPFAADERQPPRVDDTKNPIRQIRRCSRLPALVQMLWPAESSRQRPPRRTAPRTIVPLPLAIRGSPYDLSNQIVSSLTTSYTPKYLAGLWPLT